MYPLEASRALKRISAHIQMADGAGVPGVRMVADGAWVRMDITTNKDQCQDKETPKGGPVNKKKRSRPVVTGQWAARRKNSPRQWGRPFGRAPREICPAISTEPHWGGDCTTITRWQDVGAGPVGLPVGSRCRSGRDSSTGRSSWLKSQSNYPFWQLKDI